MECRVAIDLLSEYIDGSHQLKPEGEVRAFEEHLAGCSTCQNLRTELTEIKMAARELPMHTPPKAMWTRIANVIEAELPASERPTLIEAPEMSWWERLKSRQLTLTLPQLAGAGGLAVLLFTVGIFYSRPSSTGLSLTNVQSAVFVPEEMEWKQELDQRLRAIDARKAGWDSQVRAEFEQHLNKIEESLKLCRQELKKNPQDDLHRHTLRALYTEKRQLLDDVERLKW